jgi:hypothetical protein
MSGTYLMLFDVFDYILDEICNITTNFQRSYGFAPYIKCMIEVVAHEKFYKDDAHESLRSVVPKDPWVHHSSSPSLVAAPTRTTRCDGASSSSSTNTGILKMFKGIFAMCHCIDQHMDVMEQQMRIIHCNQEIIHSQWDEPLHELPDVPVYPPVADPYTSLTPAELAASGMGPSRAPAYDVDDDDEETEDDE